MLPETSTVDGVNGVKLMTWNNILSRETDHSGVAKHRFEEVEL